VVDYGKLAVLDLGEPGKQIGEKLFVLLDAEQQRELTHYVLTRNKQDCAPAENSYVISHTSTLQADVELPLTEIQEGELYFCLEEREVSIRGEKVDLSAREFNTLYLLLMNRKRVMTFETIAYHVWGEEYVENELTAIHNIMSRLRQKLKTSPDISDYIISVRGVGYKFDTT
jgi:DNA-binding response OmpR family regulator